uniref:glutathione gamma-glutamylcysteinyltransferase-like n=1 Tax=Styela clava TaxID=7725 RepID=UPI001939D99F|nr:glutathione gamma-glutamylcysteinyltransferase-like [Styela clava]
MASRLKTCYRNVLPPSCIPFTSDKGKKYFKEALPTGHMNCYFVIGSQYKTQEEPGGYSGLSSLVMVLNAFHIDPGIVWKWPFRWYHEDMLHCCTSLEEIRKNGISIENLLRLARCNNLEGHVKRFSVESNIDEFRDVIKNVTLKEDVAMILSYNRSTLGQIGSGHLSPIGGYNPIEDKVLILDVERFKYPPHWVCLHDLWNAIKSIDESTGLPHGYVKLWRADTIIEEKLFCNCLERKKF